MYIRVQTAKRNPPPQAHSPARLPRKNGLGKEVQVHMYFDAGDARNQAQTATPAVAEKRPPNTPCAVLATGENQPSLKIHNASNHKQQQTPPPTGNV